MLRSALTCRARRCGSTRSSSRPRASGGSGSYEYQFLIKAETGAAWITAQTYSNGRLLDLDTTGSTPGTYAVMVYVRNQGSASFFDMARTLSFSVVAVPPAKAGSFTASSPSPRMKGPEIVFTAQASGGSGSYEYKFLRKLSTSLIWTTVQSYGTNTWTWDTSTATPGTYNLRVNVRNQGSLAAYEAIMNMNYSVVAASPVTGATLAVDVASPQKAGALVTLTAQGVGGSGAYEYQFLRKHPSSTTWDVVQDYGNASGGTWEWDTDGVTLGTYALKVNVRNNGSAALYEVVRSMNYTITLDDPATGGHAYGELRKHPGERANTNDYRRRYRRHRALRVQVHEETEHQRDLDGAGLLFRRDLGMEHVWCDARDLQHKGVRAEPGLGGSV